MSNDRYLDVLYQNVAAVKEGQSPDRLMPLLQWLMNYRPAECDGNDVEYKTTAEIQVTLSEMVTLDLNEISTVMWRLGYEVSVVTIHPAWAMKPAD
jgi:hypothetical protein